MITPSLVYWITRLEGINALFAILLAFSIVTAIVTGVICLMALTDGGDSEPEFKLCLKICKRAGFVGIVAAIGVIMLPTTKEAAAIVVIPKIANSETVQELGSNFVQLANDWLVELRPNKDKDK
jgi:hypothetical protein